MTTENAQVQLDAQGLVTAICQDEATGEVLMVAHMNREALERTIESGEMHFYSRSRQELWHKGETSGSYPSGVVGADRLRRRRAAVQGTGRRAGMPHGRAVVLLPGGSFATDVRAG